MAISNRDRVSKGLDLLLAGLLPFVERELTEHVGQGWFEVVSRGIHHGLSKGKDGVVHWDPAALLKAMQDQ